MSIEKLINENKVIGRHRYFSLKSSLSKLDQTSTDELVMFRKLNKISVADAEREIKKYEIKYATRVLLNARELLSESAINYLKNIGKEKVVEKKEMTKDWLFNSFDKEYYKQNKTKYSRDKESIENLKPLIYYFIGDLENFKKCNNVSIISKPSLNKGLLIIGGYGNGKTSVMKAFETVLRRTNITFINYSANEIVTMYENCQSPIEKKEFKRKVELGTRSFDDVLTERMASNYGKANIMKDILEERYNKGKRTYITLNYKDEFDQDGKPIYNLQTGLNQIGEKYGSRVYDRLFEMFNIIEFKGKSFRK